MVSKNPIKETFEKLRGEMSGRIYLKKINERYYVYRESGVWDKEKKKTKIKSEYMGKILPDGTFFKKLNSYADDFEKAKAIIAERGGKILWPESKEETLLPAEMTEDEVDNKLLTILSMNARASFSSMGKLVGLSPAAAYNRVKNLEKAWHIHYLPEIDLNKLGYTTYLILIKFTNGTPSMGEMKSTLEKNPRVQLALSTKGESDLMVFFLTEMGENARFNISKAREDLFPNYDAEWMSAPVYPTYGFIPVNEKFFDVLKARVWNRSKEVPRQPEDSISNNEYSLLLELSKNGAIDFSEVDKKYGFDNGRAQYAYHKLKKKGIIRRITASITGLPMKYLAVLYAKEVNGNSWEESRPLLLAHIIKETKRPINQYALVGDTGIPNGGIFMFPVFDEKDLEIEEKELFSIMKNAKITTSIVTSSFAGSLCFRKFDNMYSRQYSRLVNDYKTLQDKQKLNYD